MQLCLVTALIPLVSYYFVHSSMTLVSASLGKSQTYNFEIWSLKIADQDFELVLRDCHLSYQVVLNCEILQISLWVRWYQIFFWSAWPQFFPSNSYPKREKQITSAGIEPETAYSWRDSSNHLTTAPPKLAFICSLVDNFDLQKQVNVGWPFGPFVEMSSDQKSDSPHKYSHQRRKETFKFRIFRSLNFFSHVWKFGAEQEIPEWVQSN